MARSSSGFASRRRPPDAEDRQRAQSAAPSIPASPPRKGLDSDFNSLDAQREAGEAYVASQRNEGWVLLPDRYDDGGFSGGSLERPALQRLLRDVEAGRIDCIVVYKVDRLSRSLMDFSKLVELFDRHKVSFVSVTQHFNTTDSMGRLTLNILLSFAQFEREIIAERIRDKIAAAKKKGKRCGGMPVLGYDLVDGKLVVNPTEAKLVRHIFDSFLRIGSPTILAHQLNEQGHATKTWTTRKGKERKGGPWNKAHLYRLFHNRTYLGQVTHKGNAYRGEHAAIIPQELWDKAHSILAKNYHARTAKTKAETPALLKGLIRCGHCQTSMGITFTRKAGRMYRYYLCLNASKTDYGACPVKSVAAGDIERVVVDHLRNVLRDPEITARISRMAESPLSIEEIRDALQNVDALWDELFPGEQARIVELLVEGVVVEEKGIVLTFRANGLRSLALAIAAAPSKRALRQINRTIRSPSASRWSSSAGAAGRRSSFLKRMPRTSRSWRRRRNRLSWPSHRPGSWQDMLDAGKYATTRDSPSACASARPTSRAC